jgi:hypothetical protein
VSEPYPFDPGVRDHVARLLYELLPALYRVRDGQSGELHKFLRVLAAPLAEVRQNIEELHADLFIDTCNDWVIPYLAEMIGTTLVFPDAHSNRRDVRGTVSWRRRKGTPGALQEMSSDLSEQMVVTQEGWKRLLLAQDLNLPRTERTVANVRQAILFESAQGPLDATFHTLDPRSISASSGRFHPRHVIHWLHPTRLSLLREGTAHDRTAGDTNEDPHDLRYTIHPLGIASALRVRRTHPQDPIATDRVLAVHFAEAPGTYFDQEGRSGGRFLVRLSGLPGAVAAPVKDLRRPSHTAAGASLIGAPVAVSALEHTLDRLTADVHLEVFAVPMLGASLPDVGAAQWCGGATFSAQPKSDPPDPGATPVAGGTLTHPVAMIRLRAVSPATAAHFPGATVELASAMVDALHASIDPTLAVEGFLRGALIVEIPRTWVFTDRWFYLAADGSIYEAQTADARATGALPNIALIATGAGYYSLPGDALAIGPGPAFPPLQPTAVQERMMRLPSAPGRGPVILHGGKVLENRGSALAPLADADNTDMGLVFAARFVEGGIPRYEPFLRLTWKGDDPLSAEAAWSVLAADGTPIGDGAGRGARFHDIALLRRLSLELVVRFETSQDHLVLPPCEVAWSSDDGQTILIHLPALETGVGPASAWNSSPLPFSSGSAACSVGADGSTRLVNTTTTARYALGAVAPLPTATLRRRRVRYRSLCQWDHETPTKQHRLTPPGFLDIDPQHGLFALGVGERARAYPSSPDGPPLPAAVTADYLDGYSDHIGARPDAREPILNQRQPRPTRLVSATGRLHRSAPADWHEIPRYTTLGAALDAISGSPDDEIIQFEDSATYIDDTVNRQWPSGPPSLTLQAAEAERPVIRLGGPFGPTAGASYTSVTLRGIAIGGLPRNGLGPDTTSITFPPATSVTLQFCTITSATCKLTFHAPSDNDGFVLIERCITGPLFLNGPGTLCIRDSVVDAAGGKAIEALKGTCELARTTVIAHEADLLPDAPGTDVLVLEATDVIFDHRVQVGDRFHGCIRYSRVLPGSILPRQHRVITDSVRFVSRDRHNPAHARLAAGGRREILRGAEDGSEMGAFHGVRLAQRYEALVRRLVDFTPAGISTGIIRID